MTKHNMVCCSEALYRQSNRNLEDLSFFDFLWTNDFLCLKLKLCRRADSRFEEEQREAITGEEHNLRNYNEYSANDSHRKRSTVDVS